MTKHSEIYSNIKQLRQDAFNTSGNKGIACGLNNLMKLTDGESLGGRSTADADFGGLEDDDLM